MSRVLKKIIFIYEKNEIEKHFNIPMSGVLKKNHFHLPKKNETNNSFNIPMFPLTKQNAIKKLNSFLTEFFFYYET